MHLPHEEDPEADQEKEGRPRHQRRQPRALAWLLARDLDVFVAEHVDQFRILHRYDGLETFTAGEVTADFGIRDRYFLHIVAVDFFKEPAEWKDLISPGRSMLHDLIQQNRRRENQDPEQNCFCCRIQLNPQPASRTASPDS